MDKFIVEGGKKLTGEISVKGAKNSVLPILAATILIEKGESIIENVPNLSDIRFMLKILNYLGAETHFDQEKGIIRIDSSNIHKHEAPYDLVRKMRASFVVAGPILARFNKAKISLPGGCALGARPVNLHLKGFRKMGAIVEEHHGYIYAETKGFKGGEVFFDRPSHTGTENIMMAGALSDKETIIVNAATDPEIVDVANFLRAIGVDVRGDGTPIIKIKKGKTKTKPVRYICSGDRLTAGTYLMGAAITGGKVRINGIEEDTLQMVTGKLREMGCIINSGKQFIELTGPERLKPIEIITAPYPGFPTDLQPIMMALCTVADGTSYIRETIFENRLTHVMEFRRLGAHIKVSGDEAFITGVPSLDAAEIMASDIRAGAALVIAGLAAKGKTEILRIYHIDRGYEKMESDLHALGANISRVV